MDEINIPLPPLAEQHRIVAKVDELMALCDQLEAAKAEREQSRNQLVAASLQRLNDVGQNRHSGRECRNPEAMDGKPNHIPVARMPSVRDGMTDTEDAAFFLSHLPRLTTRPAHIKQLRQTILNLAVRGKLVEQDHNDEPATELIKRFTLEKRRLLSRKELVLWDFAWWAIHCNLSKLLVPAKVEAQALEQVCPVEYPIATPQ